MRRPVVCTVAAILLAGFGGALAAKFAGLEKVGVAFGRLTPAWLVAALGVQTISIIAYVVSYESVVREVTGRKIPRRTIAQLVLTGFGAFRVSGGFTFDERTLQHLGLRASAALRTVLVLGGVEFISLVWLAFGAALIVLALDPFVSAGMVWPWLIAVPIGTGVAVLIRRREPPEESSAEHHVLAALRWSLADVLALARRPRRFVSGWAGILVYWLADAATLYLTVRTFGLRPRVEAVGLAYATGYLVSRRTLPLGGAGFVELLMTFSLYWMHEALAPALAGVLAYRGLNLLLLSLPAHAARRRLEAALLTERPSFP